ncbi:MAG: dTDP-4-amino-4,6-dideoxygalactose transaminase [Acidobacteria bacterium]|nr:MAG: dTDP-4-amino-4,6-dideoxygalactose transaminase [Acidobacteriota bacterium]
MEYMREAIANQQISGDGTFTRKVHALLEQLLGAQKSLLTTSCTDALEMAALLLDVEPGDEVILPSFTFVSTANAFALRGARPIFVDIRPDTLNIDESRIEALITRRTKAIVVVHYAGVGCEMQPILDVASRYGISVVEDNAHGLLGAYRGRPLGSFGTFATLSFHETKNFTCGEGGALVVNDPRYIERAEIVREKGTDRSRFFRGQVDKYGWIDIGSSYLPSDLLAAFLLAQLESRDRIQAHRRRVWETYRAGLAQWAEAFGVALPIVPADRQQAYHLFYLLVPSLADRVSLIEHLKESGISAVFHYLPLHLSEMGRRFGGRPGDCPVTEDISDRLLRLPFYNDLSDDDQRSVITGLQGFSNWAPRKVRPPVVRM